MLFSGFSSPLTIHQTSGLLDYQTNRQELEYDSPLAL